MTDDSPSVDVIVRYIGGPTTIIEIAGVRFITDPTFDEAGRDYPSGPVVTLRKTMGPGVALADVGDLDVALVSHQQHPDNLDDAGRQLLKRIPVILTAPTSAEHIRGAVGLAPGGSREVVGAQGTTLRVTATPARHGPHGAERFAGEVIGFMIEIVETGEALVYITGDTVWFDGVRGVAKTFQPRVVILHGGAATTSRSVFQLTMNANDAVELAAVFPAATIVPVHHEGWAHFVQSQEDLVNAFRVLGLERLQVVEAGASYTFST